MHRISLSSCRFFKHLGRFALIVVCGLPSLAAWAQGTRPVATAPVRRNFLVVRGGYTGGKFVHSTNDYRPSIFGGQNSLRSGQPVKHRFDGLLLGADFEQQYQRIERNRTVSVVGGLDLLAASDRLTIGASRRERLSLWALHPHFAFGLANKNWQIRGGVGVLLGRVGYYGISTSGYVLTTTIVDTVDVVPTFQTRTGWRNWVLVENGYGANGLLGLANPAWQVGIGTGFGPRSPFAVLVGAIEPESADFEGETYGFGYLRLEAMPVGSPWRADGLITFGSESYGRVALQVSYRFALSAVAPAAQP